ncbi:GNAT family N-acetyltransferase [Halocynthiibacter namhaensis]|uniref:GNAT family N-acetyltransferase n=1 Tax=Halocynthiibacter namhaensis TaxID=1290553 RepID=UPI00068AFF09|nr:GNAT family N-acetyltransferase [Halocynthiibacter namhaensis]
MIREITIQTALPVRQAVLWPGHPLSHAEVPGDHTAVHFGVYDGVHLVCVGSLFHDDNGGVQLRKLATLPSQQGKGHGRAVIQTMLERIGPNQRFWCDARVSAMGFYEKLGMIPVGEAFTKNERSYQQMERSARQPAHA